MTKIDFSKFPCYVDIRKKGKIEMNLKFDFANAMYMRGQGIAMGALAMKIYNAEGEEEYNEQECKIILDFAYMVNPIVADSIKDYLEEHKQ